MAEAASVMSNTPANQSADFRAVLRNRNFLYLWLAQIISQLAQQMINFALVVQVTDLSAASGTAVAGIIICFTVPAILFSAIAGVFVDRQSKKRMLVITNVGRGVVVLLYVVTILVPNLSLGYGLIVLYVNTLIFSAVSQFFVPAEAAMIPLLVPRGKLIAANALFNLTFTAAQLIGFAFLGPLFVGLIGYKWLYVVLFACYGFCAWLTWRLPDLEADRVSASAGLRQTQTDSLGDKVGLAWREFKEGWDFIRVDPPLMTAIVYWSVAISVFMMMGTIGPNFLRNVLHVDPQHLYFIMVPGGIGLVLGVMLVGRYATEQNRPAMINYSLLIAGAALLVLALAHNGLQFGAQVLNQPPPPVAISQIVIGALAFFLGIVNSFISVPAQTVLQERAPEHIRARVFSAFYTVSNAILIVPILFAGTMADLLGVVQTVVLIAVAVLVIAFVGLRYQQAHSRVLTPGRANTSSGPQEEPEALLAGVTAVEMGGEQDFLNGQADLEAVAGPFQRAR